ncbi:MAG: PilZ domain-containing protein [Bryobacteraceae bacterium]
MPSKQDQRRGHRYALKLACELTSPLETFDAMLGVTENISRSGILVHLSDRECPELPQLGTLTRAVVRLPASPNAREPILDCLAKVVRVNRDAGARSIALEVRRMRFQSVSNGSAVSDLPLDEEDGRQYIQ